MSYHRGPLLAAASGLAALGLFVGAPAAEPVPPFAELVAQADATAPRLAEARAAVSRAEGLALQASAFPNPTIGIDRENFSGTGPYSGSGVAETTATLGQTLELGGKRAARIGVGRAELDAARRREAQARTDFRFDLALAYAEAEASDRRLILAEDTLAAAKQDAAIARAFVQAGREPELRRLQAEASLQSALAALDEAQAARATAFSNLTALAGAATPFTSIPTSLLDQGASFFGRRSLDPEHSVAILVAEAEREAAQRRVTLERRQAVPDLSVSVGVRRFSESDSTALVAGVSAPLPLFDRNKGNVRAARADVNAAEARLNAARLDAAAAVRSGTARIAAAEARLSAALEGERVAQEAYRLTRIGYEAGKIDLAELLNTRRALTDARAQSIAAAVERIGAQAALVRLTGVAETGVPQ